MRRRASPRPDGFTFLEVMVALAVLLVGSVAILSLFAVGTHHLIERKIEARLVEVRPEVEYLIQRRFDATEPGRAPEALGKPDDPYAPGVELSRPGYFLKAWFEPSMFGGSHRYVARAVIYFRGKPVRVLPPIPLFRSTLAPD